MPAFRLNAFACFVFWGTCIISLKMYNQNNVYFLRCVVDQVAEFDHCTTVFNRCNAEICRRWFAR